MFQAEFFFFATRLIKLRNKPTYRGFRICKNDDSKKYWRVFYLLDITDNNFKRMRDFKSIKSSLRILPGIIQTEFLLKIKISLYIQSKHELK